MNSFIIASIGVIVAGAVFVELQQRYENRKFYQQEYHSWYNRISAIIEKSEVTEENYQWIKVLLNHLKDMPYKNHEMTSVLSGRFVLKFQDEMIKAAVSKTFNKALSHETN
jgi:hypothetical protein